VIAAGAFLFAFLMFARKGGLSDKEAIHTWAYFRDASGLSAKSRVQIAGIPVGEVSEITLEGTRAKVWLKIRRGVDLREDASITKRSESLLGDYLLDLNPGSDKAPPLTDGEQIRRVVDTQGVEAIFESLSQITSDIQQVTAALRGVLGGEKGQGSLERIVDNLIRLSEAVDATVRVNSERLNAILINFEGVSQDVRNLTHSNEADVNRIVDNIEGITRDVREVLASVKKVVGSGEGDLKEGVASVKDTLNKLNSTLDNLDNITSKVRSGNSAVGALLTDERLGQKLSETVEDVSDYATRLTGLQTEVGITSTYLMETGRSKNYLSLRLIPKPDKYYLFEVIDDPRGSVSTEIVQSNPPATGEPVTQVRTVTKDTFKISAQFAKRYYFTTLRVGLIESTGGVGADFHFFNDALTLKMDAFNFAAPELRYPRLRTTLRLKPLEHLYLVGGVDDFLNAQQRDPTTNRLLAGRDYFFGGGISFTDDDLKAILSAVPVPTP
jgi:phospholipid/cholesterol/gamma-HCH transport system substrate-binding protein